MMKKYLTLLLNILLSLYSTAQTVRGTVADTQHQPLIGASVLEQGTQNGTATDPSGHFTLKLENQGSKLIISYSGFVADTLKANLNERMYIMLEENTSELSEVIVRANSTFF